SVRLLRRFAESGRRSRTRVRAFGTRASRCAARRASPAARRNRRRLVFKPANSRAARQRRHMRIRKRVTGTPERPRLCVFRSINHIYAQVIDDAKGITLAAASTAETDQRKITGTKSERAKAVGTAIAERA